MPLVILLLAGMAPAAQAQAAPLLPALTLDASPDEQATFPGDAATFQVAVGNPALTQRTARLTAFGPDNWTANLTPSSLAIAGGATNNTTLVVGVPASLATYGPFTVTIEARDDLDAITRVNVSVVVKPRPAKTETQPAPLPAPALALSVSTGDAGASGETVLGQLRLVHTDPARDPLSVELSIVGDAAWAPQLQASDRFRVLDRDRAVTIPLRVTVPALSENRTEAFTILARVDGYTFSAAWTVVGIAPPSNEAPAATGSATSGTTTTPTRAAATPALEVLVQPLEIPVAPGESARGTYVLRNTGGLPLRLTLRASPPVGWAPVAWDASAVELAPGEAREVGFTISAPEGLPLNGDAVGQLTASGDGILRTTQFHLRIVAPSAPRQETTAARVVAPEAPDGGLPAAAFPTTLVMGLGMVGAGAVALAHRPTREKLLWLGVGLYTRLARPDVLGHEDREKLYRLVETQPGIHFHALQRDLAWNTGTLTYHLRVLEKHGFMVSRRDGLYRRFYLSGAAPRKEVFENAGPTGLRADVMEAVKNSPGISQSDLALGLGANKQTVNYHVKALERQGSIRVEKRGRDTFLYPASAPAHGPGYAQA